MPGKTDQFEVDVLKLLLNGTPIPNIADNAAASPIINIWVSLHTFDPTDAAAAQNTNEVTYPGYFRVATNRGSSYWSVVNSTGDTTAKLVSDVVFPMGNGISSNIATHVGLGTASSGAGKLLWYGALNPAVQCGNGISPILKAGFTLIRED